VVHYRRSATVLNGSRLAPDTMPRQDLELSDLLRQAVEGFLLDLHTQMRGNVVSYDEATKTCEVKIAAKRPVPDGAGGYVMQDIPNIPNVPVAWPSAGGFILHFPLAVGDSVFLTFDEVDVQRWEGNGEVCEPGWLERHGLSCPLAHPYSRLAIATTGANMVCPSPFSFGNAVAAHLLARADKLETELGKIALAFSTFIPGSGGASFPNAYSAPSSGSTACTKVKSE